MIYYSTNSDYYLGQLILRRKEKKFKKNTRKPTFSPFSMVGARISEKKESDFFFKAQMRAPLFKLKILVQKTRISK